MWKPFFILHVGRESLPAWLLLANRPQGCDQASSKVQGMPVPCETNPHTSSARAAHPPIMALHSLGVDILGPFPKAIGGYEYLYIAIDKFTKWPETLAVRNIDKNSALPMY